MFSIVDILTGKVRKWLSSSSGSLHVNPVAGPQTQPRVKFRSNVSTVKANAASALFYAGDNITEIVVACTPTTPEAAQTGDYGIIAIDPASDGIAQLMLTQTDSDRGEQGWIPIFPDEPQRIPLTAALKEGLLGGGRIELLSVGVAMDFVVVGY